MEPDFLDLQMEYVFFSRMRGVLLVGAE